MEITTGKEIHSGDEVTGYVWGPRAGHLLFCLLVPTVLFIHDAHDTSVLPQALCKPKSFPPSSLGHPWAQHHAGPAAVHVLESTNQPTNQSV